MTVRRWSAPYVYITAAIVAAAGFLLVGTWRRDREQHAAPMLEVRIDSGRVNVSSNPESPSVRQAQNGVLTILDGSQEKRIPLDASVLRSGKAITYVPASDKIKIKLEITGANRSEQSQSVVAIVRPPRVQPAPPPMIAQVPERANETQQRVPHPDVPSLLQTAAVKRSGGEGLKRRGYRSARPTRKATPKVPDHYAMLLRAPVEIDVRIDVNARGAVIKARPISQTGSFHGSLEEEAALTHAVVDAARQWRFKPAAFYSRPVRSQVILSFRFAPRGC